MAQDQFTLNGTPILEDDLRSYLAEKLGKEVQQSGVKVNWPNDSGAQDRAFAEAGPSDEQQAEVRLLQHTIAGAQARLAELS